MILAWNGATGSVGRRAIHYVVGQQHPFTSVRLLGRQESRLQDVATEIRQQYPHITVDIFPNCVCDAHTNPAFFPGHPLEGVDVVVNTAGPGYSITPVLASYCAQHGLDFVDPAGDYRMVRELSTAEESTFSAGSSARIILGAGIQPGLSGILVRLLAEHVGPGCSMDVYAGGAQPITAAAVDEFVQSTVSDIRWGNKEWCDGTMVSSTLSAEDLSAIAATFSPTATAHSHCDKEVAVASQNAQAHKLRWCNINDAPHASVEIQKYMTGNSTLEAVLAAGAVDDFGRQHYFRMVGQATSAAGERWTTALECVDSFDVTASVTNQCVVALALDRLNSGKSVPPGVWLPCEIDIAARLWEAVPNDVSTAYIVPFTQVDDTSSSLGSYVPEEGEL